MILFMALCHMLIPRHIGRLTLSDDLSDILGVGWKRLLYLISESVSEDNLFYIVSPKDVVVARQRDEDDHIAWLLQHEKYEVNMGESFQECS